MNCFQICIFVLIATTALQLLHPAQGLWIAFKFVSLYWSQQREWWIAKPVSSCELLSNLYLCTDRNNRCWRYFLGSGVVNCFQICIFVLIATTQGYLVRRGIVLWIAFKFVSLYWSQQPLKVDHNDNAVVNCFQICIFVLIATTVTRANAERFLVVNCFQICIFVLIATTASMPLTMSSQLWIAFKFVSLYWSQQLLFVSDQMVRRCELLSNLYLCTDRNN